MIKVYKIQEFIKGENGVDYIRIQLFRWLFGIKISSGQYLEQLPDDYNKSNNHIQGFSFGTSLIEVNKR